MADEPAPAPNPSPAAPLAPVTDPAAPAPAVAAPATPDPKAAEPAVVVPEKYDFKDLKLPEGVALNQALVDAVSPLLLKKGYTQAEANELIETHSKALVEVSKADEAKRESDFAEWMKTNVTEWQAAVRKEWGTSYDANLTVAQRGMARVFSAEGKAILDAYGLGNHPEFVKAFFKVGQMVSEDTLPGGAQPNGVTRDPAKLLYPTMPTH